MGASISIKIQLVMIDRS